jgi:integrase
MVRARFPGINKVRKKLADGSNATYYYHRATGQRLEGTPGTPEFVTSYAAAEKTLVARHTGRNVNGLIRAFTTSVEFTEKLAASTQREYKRMLTKVEPKFGSMPVEALNDPYVRRVFLDWRESVAKSSGQREADNRLSAVSAMLSWAVERRPDEVSTNHVKGFKRLYQADRSEIIWLPEHIHAFMRVAPLEIQRVMILALHTGQRQGDLLRLPWSAYDGSAITLRQGKSRRSGKPGPPITIPCTAALRRMLDGMERRSPLILTTKTGLALKKRYFARQWEQATKDAGLEKVTLPALDEPVSLHMHDVRGTAVTMLSEAGSSSQAIATITGHSLKTVHAILERYLARTRSLAEQAIFNFENSPRTEFANRLQTAPPVQNARKGKRNEPQ